MKADYGAVYKRLVVPTLAPMDGMFVMDLSLAENGTLKIPETPPSWAVFDATVVLVDVLCQLVPPCVFAALAVQAEGLASRASGQNNPINARKHSKIQ